MNGTVTVMAETRNDEEPRKRGYTNKLETSLRLREDAIEIWHAIATEDHDTKTATLDKILTNFFNDLFSNPSEYIGKSPHDFQPQR